VWSEENEVNGYVMVTLVTEIQLITVIPSCNKVAKYHFDEPKETTTNIQILTGFGSALFSD